MSGTKVCFATVEIPKLYIFYGMDSVVLLMKK